MRKERQNREKISVENIPPDQVDDFEGSLSMGRHEPENPTIDLDVDMMDPDPRADELDQYITGCKSDETIAERAGKAGAIASTLLEKAAHGLVDRVRTTELSRWQSYARGTKVFDLNDRSHWDTSPPLAQNMSDFRRKEAVRNIFTRIINFVLTLLDLKETGRRAADEAIESSMFRETRSSRMRPIPHLFRMDSIAEGVWTNVTEALEEHKHHVEVDRTTYNSVRRIAEFLIRLTDMLETENNRKFDNFPFQIVCDPIGTSTIDTFLTL